MSIPTNKSIRSVSYNGVNIPLEGTTPTGNIALTATTSTQTGIDVSSYATASVAPTPSESKSVTTNGTVTPTSGKLLSSVSVNVPTGTARSSRDLTVSGATVTVPAGLYSAQATKSVASGTQGTPIATKGSVSNHSVSVTPSCTDTTGYISGTTKTGTAVTVTASELVSGSETKTANGTYDVTNLASVIVNVPLPSGAKWYGFRQWSSASIGANLALKNENWTNTQGTTGIVVGDIIILEVTNTDNNVVYAFLIHVTSMNGTMAIGDAFACVEIGSTVAPVNPVTTYDGSVS